MHLLGWAALVVGMTFIQIEGVSGGAWSHTVVGVLDVPMQALFWERWLGGHTLDRWCSRCIGSYYRCWKHWPTLFTIPLSVNCFEVSKKHTSFWGWTFCVIAVLGETEGYGATGRSMKSLLCPFTDGCGYWRSPNCSSKEFPVPPPLCAPGVLLIRLLGLGYRS